VVDREKIWRFVIIVSTSVGVDGIHGIDGIVVRQGCVGIEARNAWSVVGDVGSEVRIKGPVEPQKISKAHEDDERNHYCAHQNNASRCVRFQQIPANRFEEKTSEEGAFVAWPRTDPNAVQPRRHNRHKDAPQHDCEDDAENVR